MLGKILLSLIVGMMLTGPCQAEPYDIQDRFTGDYAADYIGHYVTGAVIGGLTWYYIPESWNLSPWQRRAISVAVPIVIKGAIEIFDECPSTWDALEFGAGSIISVTILEFTF